PAARPPPTGAHRMAAASTAVRTLRSRSDFQVLPEPLGLRAADRDFRRLRVLHPKDVVPAEPRDDLLDLVDVDQVRSMHAPEHVRIQARLEVVKRSIARRPRNLACHYVNRLVRQRGI